MNKAFTLALASLLLPAISACTSVVHSFTDAPIDNNPGERTTGAWIDDEKIELAVGVNIKKAHTELEKANLSAVSFNGVVLLTGQVINESFKQQAGATALKVRGVRQVHNEIEVTGSTSLISRTNDGWLTTKVKSKLLAMEEIPGNRIKVVTENGSVYLMGLVSRQEADLATQTARNTQGVQRVVRVFEYVD